MTILNDTKLNDYESEDIFDIVVILEKSFAINFDKDAFLNIKTFGDLCDIIETYITYNNKGDCTKQQAFYKIRTAINEMQLNYKKTVTLDTKLIDLFPRHNRRRQVQLFQHHLEVNLKFLTYPDWFASTLTVGFLTSFICFFFNWKIAISGIAFFLIVLNFAKKLGKDLAIETVRELTEKATAEHYIDMRSSKFTVNRNEILNIIKEAFKTGLAIEKEQLTRDAKFSWAR